MPALLAGMTSVCDHQGWTESGQAELVRVNQADGSLVATDGMPDDALIPSLLTLADVMATGWHAAVSSRVAPGGTAVVIGDGAVGLCGVLAARELGAEKIVAMSRHEPRQAIARAFGATHVVAERDDAGVEAVMELTGGVGADSVLECVGTDQSMKTAFRIGRPGSTVGFVGAPHGVELPVRQMFVRNVGLAGGMAPVRTYLPDLLERVLDGRIDPGRVFDLTLRSTRWPRATARWTSVGRSRCSCAPDARAPSAPSGRGARETERPLPGVLPVAGYGAGMTRPRPEPSAEPSGTNPRRER